MIGASCPLVLLIGLYKLLPKNGVKTVHHQQNFMVSWLLSHQCRVLLSDNIGGLYHHKIGEK